MAWLSTDAGAPFGFWAGFIDADVTAIDVTAVKRFNRCPGFIVVWHFQRSRNRGNAEFRDPE